MLTRAAHRDARDHLRRHLAAATLEQLSLPWLSSRTYDSLDFRSRDCIHRRRASSTANLSRHRTPRSDRNISNLPFQSHDDRRQFNTSARLENRLSFGRSAAPLESASSNSISRAPPRSRAHSPPRPRSRSPQPTNSRQLATEAIGYGDPNQDIPFENFEGFEQLFSPHSDVRRTEPPRWGWTNTKPWDPQDIAIVKMAPEERAPQVKKGGTSSLPGDTALLHENLYALVKVGRFAQAERVVRRLGQIYPSDSPELLDAHHRYLTGRLEGILNSPTKAEYSTMQRWFELDLRGRDCPPNSGILAIMIKASFAALEGSRLDRTIRRYVSIAEQNDSEMKYDVISSGIFVESEQAWIMKLFPQEFNAPAEIISEGDIETRVEALKQANKYTDASALPVEREIEASGLRPAEQKGLGLQALKHSLATLSVSYGDAVEVAEGEKSPAELRQEAIESDVLTSAIERWHDEANATKEARARGQLSDPMLGSYVYEWIQGMVAIIKEEMKRGEEAEGSYHESGAENERLFLGPFLRMADPEKLCAATVVEYLNYVFDPKDAYIMDRPLVTTLTKIGSALWKEIEIQGAKKSMIEKYHSLPSSARRKKVAEMLKSQTPFQRSQTGKHYMEEEMHQSMPFADRNATQLKVKLGAKFLSTFMKVAKLPVTKEVDGKKLTQIQPVTIQALKWRAGKKIGVLKTNQALIDRLKKEPVGSFIAKHLPMTVQPRPWTGLNDGAYLKTKLQAVRFRDTSRSQQEYVQTATKRGDMKQTYAGLDVIGKVPWRINRAVFDVLAEAWNTGEAIGELAPENPSEIWPEKPPEDDAAATRRWKNLVKQVQNERTGFHSQRCYQNFQLEVARAFLNDTFYCPHTVDFRGRAYPIPPYFNHMGADYVRGLFLFARGKELGEIGLKWLKIHLANVYGFDKASLNDREQFAMDHLADIYDSASNPMTGKRWWLTAEDPWQCLAACKEIRNAYESPEPTKFISHLPVHQDGTCNGLQHYAALGGDLIGAQQVNLMPGDRPADIYSAVADMVKEYVHEDALAGNLAAQTLDGKITRKVVKQPVMTNVYGVTYHGARAQVRKQLVDVLPKASLDDTVNLGQLSAYVASLIFKALSRMFTGAHAIQHWLGDCGAKIASAITPEQIQRIKARRAGTLEEPQKLKKKRVREKDAAQEDYQFKSTIVWTTPLGMPVVQPYREGRHRAIRTSLQDVYIGDSSASDPVNKRKQLQGFPPNFIHSLDATHMMLSALKCDEIGLQFSSVHDSFWTHASDVPVMNRVLRDAFVRMHSENVVGRLREEFLARYRGCMHYACVEKASPLGKKILALRRGRGVGSEKAFGSGVVREAVQVDELLEESERQRLLNSEREEERMKGAEMVTPASLMEAEGGEAALGAETGAGISILGDRGEGGRMVGADEGAEVETGMNVPGVLHSDETDSYDDASQKDMAGADAHAEEVEESIREETDLASTEQAGLSSSTGQAGQASTGPTRQPSTDQPNEGSQAPAPAPPLTLKERKAREKKARDAGKKEPVRMKVYLWVPITFPPAPERGGFDVSELKESQYFFS